MATVLHVLVVSCAKKLQEIITEEAVLILGVKEDLIELQQTMKQVQCFLNDAEQRRTEESAVNNWLGELKDAMYYADDIIDLARSEGAKLLAKHHSSSRNSAACNDISLFSCIPGIQKRHKIGVQIRDFNAELDRISKLGKRFLKLQNMQPKSEVWIVNKKMQRSSLVEPNLVGKETLHACSRLVRKVIEHNERKAYKLGIAGTGGVGKTILAQQIYNDQKIKGNFSNQAWICVSQKYSEVSVLKEVLRNFQVHYEQDETFAEISSKLSMTVQDKSFFLVLDDVWQPEVWTNLLRIPLDAAATGVILITTRHDTVANAIGMEDVHRVELMSVDVGWELFWKSMNINEEKDVENLRNIGLDIVRKCSGLPLAIKVTASVLATKEKTENEWRKVLNRGAWSMDNLPTELRGALYLSYDDLPRHLKQCFLYFALYHEDWYISRYDLILLWIAEGFVEEHENQLLEDTAEDYYYELLYRNLVQPDPTRFDHGRCKMHDLLRQLACHFSREDTFCGDPQSMDAITLSKLRRVSIATEKDSIMLPIVNKEKIRARTLSIFSNKKLIVENTIFKILPCIRVLVLNDSSIQNIPDCIGSLIHLRLLDFDRTNISCLPESIGSLMNLQILNLQGCQALHNLPSTITQLCNLRRLGLNGTPINQVPEGIGRLLFLTDLEGFPIGGGSDIGKTQDGWKLEELRHLSRLWKLQMIKLERAISYSTDSLLVDKKHLKLLTLGCRKHLVESCSEEDVGNIEKIFEQLIPPHNLEELSIVDFFGRRFPTWLGTTNLVSIKHLNLIDCNSYVHLPPLGQLPNLKYLRIEGAAAVTKIGPEFVGCIESHPRSMVAVAFPKLEELIMKDMPNWEEWCFVEEDATVAAIVGEEDGSAEIRKGETPSPRMQLLPRLKKLDLVGCSKLRALPRQIGQEAANLAVLFIWKSSSLKVVEDLPFLSKRLSIQMCHGLERVSNLPQVRELSINRCPYLRCVEGFGSLQQLWLAENMQEISKLWGPGLQEQCQQLHGEDLDVFEWV